MGIGNFFLRCPSRHIQRVKARLSPVVNLVYLREASVRMAWSRAEKGDSLMGDDIYIGDIDCGPIVLGEELACVQCGDEPCGGCGEVFLLSFSDAEGFKLICNECLLRKHGTPPWEPLALTHRDTP